MLLHRLGPWCHFSIITKADHFRLNPPHFFNGNQMTWIILASLAIAKVDAKFGTKTALPKFGTRLWNEIRHKRVDLLLQWQFSRLGGVFALN